MELEQMRELWKQSPPEKTDIQALKLMITEKSHPVLKKIKRQLLAEMALWTVILCLYHNALDGDKRPILINLVFVTGFLQAIAYNLSSYLGAKNLIQGEDLSSSITNYIKKLKKLRFTALLSRTVLMAAILFYFCYGLEFDTKRITAMAAITTVFIVQLVVIYRLWTNRIIRLTAVTDDIDTV